MNVFKREPRRAYFGRLLKQADGGKDRSKSRQKKKGRKK